MYLNGKYINDITDADIIFLIDNKIKEDQKLEYKRQLNIKDSIIDQKEFKEFVADVASVYNSEGGCIIYGIEEEKDINNNPTGYPKRLVDNQINNPDKISLQIQNVIRNDTDPAIIGIVPRVITVQAHTILIIGIPRRWGFPSITKLGYTFFKRANTQKYQMATTELSRMFLESMQIADAFSAFADKRKSAIMDKTNPTTANFNTKNPTFLHLAPLSHVSNQFIDVRAIERLTDDFKAQHSQYHSPTNYVLQYNADGCYTVKNTGDEVASYVQMLRNGYLEYFTRTFHGIPVKPFFFGYAFIMETFWAIKRSLRLYEALNINPPFLAKFNLVNLSEKVLVTYDNRYPVGHFTAPTISSPIIFIEDLYYKNDDLFNLLKPFYDIVWQTAGKKEAMDYPSCFKENIVNTHFY